VEEFHALSTDRALRWPHTMLATSTHDNKRSEDVRNRIDVLSEMPNEWVLALTRWHGLCRDTRRQLACDDAPSRADEYLLYQTLLGTLPLGGLDAATAPAFADRIWQYMQKAAREAKLRTRWTQPDAAYEAALEGFVRAIVGNMDEGACLSDIQRLADRLSWFGAWNGLTLTLLKYASPGVPDLYQGSELIELSLVDPDNRRPVDYALRQRQLGELKRMAAAGGRGLAARCAPWPRRRTTGAPSCGSSGGCSRCGARSPRCSARAATKGWWPKGRWRGMWWPLRAARGPDAGGGGGAPVRRAVSGGAAAPVLPQGEAWRGTTVRLPKGWKARCSRTC
jgi:(1->4)-alpha-D-glucan 1-alpha-D-glucosylmutase